MLAAYADVCGVLGDPSAPRVGARVVGFGQRKRFMGVIWFVVVRGSAAAAGRQAPQKMHHTTFLHGQNALHVPLCLWHVVDVTARTCARDTTDERTSRSKSTERT
eukprot:scaffold7932_cov112-Isochrysis_galbana.AAC.2